MITLKMTYKPIENDFLNHFQREYNNAVRLSYNRWVDKDIVGFGNQYVTFKNQSRTHATYDVDIYYWLKTKSFHYIDDFTFQKAIRTAKGIYDGIFELNKYYENQNKQNVMLNQYYIDKGIIKPPIKIFELKDPKKHIFGGRENFLDRNKGKISKEKYKRNRILPINIAGDSGRNGGNRKFQLTSPNILKIKFNKEFSYEVELKPTSKKYRFILDQLFNAKNIPITYSINEDYIQITFNEADLPALKNYNSPRNPNICLGIDINPGYIGITIINKTKILYSEQLSTDNPDNNQQNSLAHMAKRINQLIHQYNVGVVSMEKLSFLPGKHSYCKKTNNKLLGWNRTSLGKYIQKYCNIYGVKFKEINPAYTSIIGNIMNQETPDACAAAIEIARRGLYGDKSTNYPALSADTFSSQGVIKDRWKDLEGVVFNGWSKLGQVLKKNKIRWRNDLPASYPEKPSVGYSKQYCSLYTVENVLQ